MTKLKHAAETLHAAKRPFVLVSVKDGTGSMPRHQGAIMLVRQDGSIVGTIGGGLLEAQAIRAAQKVFAAKRDMEQPFQLTGKQAAQDGMICGGSGTLTFRYCPPEQPLPELPEESGMLYIFGGGHVGQALAQGAVLLGWPVTVLDDRAAYADPARFPETACITVPGFDSLPDLPVGPADGIVIVTRGHLGDADVLRWAVQQNAGYIGMIGSKRKRDMLYQTLQEEGVSQTRLQQVHSPVGLDIGAETPGEIAVSILAEIIAIRVQRRNEEAEA